MATSNRTATASPPSTPKPKSRAWLRALRPTKDPPNSEPRTRPEEMAAEAKPRALFLGPHKPPASRRTIKTRFEAATRSGHAGLRRGVAKKTAGRRPKKRGHGWAPKKKKKKKKAKTEEAPTSINDNPWAPGGHLRFRLGEGWGAGDRPPAPPVNGTRGAGRAVGRRNTSALPPRRADLRSAAVSRSLRSSSAASSSSAAAAASATSAPAAPADADNYIGVYRHGAGFQVKGKLANGKTQSLGTFPRAEVAARVYDDWARRNPTKSGRKRLLNFS